MVGRMCVRHTAYAPHRSPFEHEKILRHRSETPSADNCTVLHLFQSEKVSPSPRAVGHAAALRRNLCHCGFYFNFLKAAVRVFATSAERQQRSSFRPSSQKPPHDQICSKALPCLGPQ